LTAAAVLLAVAALPLLAASAYLLLLVILSKLETGPSAGPPRLRFDVIVPAHDEEQNIAQTVGALLALDWPRELFRVVVVADNCSDATAARAAEAGADVLVRNDATLRGKGYALQLAFEKSLAGSADAVVVIDADTVVTQDLLRAFAARLERGAKAVQADYAVRNPDASWRTRLMSIAFSAFHQLRSTGRERLGVSCGLRGNGMCFSREVLREVPHEAFSIVEDVEYGIRLGEAGYRVHHAGEAHVYGEMVAGEKASRSQRRRWEGGRLQLAKLHGPRLLRLGLARRSSAAPRSGHRRAHAALVDPGAAGRRGDRGLAGAVRARWSRAAAPALRLLRPRAPRVRAPGVADLRHRRARAARSALRALLRGVEARAGGAG
jgi:cellulose synthase/poly-beta-1,6-N-acetylglucosamine synthase-like glycosyltransferase